VQLVSKISNLCDPDPPTLQTDGRTDRQTDGQHAISIPRYAQVHRAVKTAMLTCKTALPDSPHPIIISKNPGFRTLLLARRTEFRFFA